MITENTFNISYYSNELKRTYGDETNLEIEDAVEILIDYKLVSSQYSEEELQDELEKIWDVFWMGNAIEKIKITKNTPRHGE